MDRNITPVIEGKSKKFFDNGDGTLTMVFKPHLRSVTSKREGNIAGTDIERMLVNKMIFREVEKAGIETHMLSAVLDADYGMKVVRTQTIPIEFICRYYAAGSIVRLYPSIVKPDMKFKYPLYKYDLKQDVSVADVDDPTLNESYIVGLELMTEEQLCRAKHMLGSIGELVHGLLKKADMTLIDMKMEFGLLNSGDIVLIDEISQDCIRANDTSTWKPMTKDAYRNMESDEEVLEKYKEFRERLSQVI